MARYCPYCVSKIEQGNSCPYCNYAYTYKRKEYYLKPGTILNGKYLVGRVLGEGGFGITYVGRDLTLDLKVAIKEYYPNGVVGRTVTVSDHVSLLNWTFSSSFENGKDRFIEEARTIAKMDKENAVVTVRDFFEENNSAYLVMEYVEGENLYSIMQKRGSPFEAKELFPLLEPVFSALSELHEIGLIHRDISPDNIMIEDDRARLIDFGCARTSFQRAENEDSVLKHGFSPIEQYENRDMGPWTDVYAMAATIYYCITGNLIPVAPVRAKNDTLQSPRDLGIKLSKKQDRALMKALSVDRNQRFQTIGEFGKALFIHRNYYKMIAIGAGAAAVLTLAILALHSPGQRIEDLKVYRVAKPVYTQNDSLNDDEKTVIRQMGDLISQCSIEPSPTQNGYQQILIENTTGYDLGDIEIYFKMYEKDGTVCGSTWTRVNDFEKGKRAAASFWGQGMKPDHVETKVQIEYNDKTLETPYYPLSAEGFGDHSLQAVQVVMSPTLPVSVQYLSGSAKAVYRITSVTPDVRYSGSDYYMNIILAGVCESCSNDSWGGSINYRLTNENGSVIASSSVRLPKLKSGETFDYVEIYVSNLEKGIYTLELSDYTN